MNSDLAKPLLAPKPKTPDHPICVIKYPTLMSKSSVLQNPNSVSRGPKPPIAPKPVVLPATDQSPSLCANSSVNKCTNGEMAGSDEEISEGTHCSTDCTGSKLMEIINDEYIVVPGLRNEELCEFLVSADREPLESAERNDNQEENRGIASDENSQLSAVAEIGDNGPSNIVETVNYDSEESIDIENNDNHVEMYHQPSPAAEMDDLVSTIVDDMIDFENNPDAIENGFTIGVDEMFHDVNLIKDNEYNPENASTLDMDEDVSSSTCDKVIFTDLTIGDPFSVGEKPTNPEFELCQTLSEEEEEVVNAIMNVCSMNDDYELNAELELVNISTVDETTSSKDPGDDEGTDAGLEMAEDEQHDAEFSGDSCSDADVDNEREASFLITAGATDSENGTNIDHEDNVDDGYQTIEIKSEEETSEAAHDEMEDLKEEDMTNYDIDDSCQIIPFENEFHEDVVNSAQGNLDGLLPSEDCRSYSGKEPGIPQHNLNPELESGPEMGLIHSSITECILEENCEDLEVDSDEPLDDDDIDTSKDKEVDSEDSAGIQLEKVIEEKNITGPLAENDQSEIINDDECKNESRKYLSSTEVIERPEETDEDDSNPYVLGDSLPLKCSSTIHGEEPGYFISVDGPSSSWSIREQSMDVENNLLSFDRKNIVTRSRSHSGKLPGCVPETVPEEPGPETDLQSPVSYSVSPLANLQVMEGKQMDGNRILPAKPRRFILYPRSYSVEGRDSPVSVYRDSEGSIFEDRRIKRKDDNLSLPCVISSSGSFSQRSHYSQGSVSTPSSVVDIPPPFELACITKKPITKSSPSLLIESESPDKYFKKKKLSFKRFLTLKFRKKTENKVHVDVNVSSSRSSSESSHHGPARVVELDRRSLGSSPQLKSRSGKVRASESPSMVLFYKDGKRKGTAKTFSRTVARVESFEDRARPPFLPLPLTKPRSISFPNADTSDYENIPAMSSDYENIQIPSRRHIRTGTFTEFFEDPSRALSSANENDGYVDMSSFNTLEIKQETAEQESDSAYTEPYKVCPIALAPLEDVTSDEEQKSSEDEETSPADVSLAHKKEGQARVQFIAEELLSSEKEYVEMLRRLQMGFYTAVLEVLGGDDDDVTEEAKLHQGWSELPEISQLHQEILSELKERIQDWQENQKIAGVFLSRESIFKHHVAYVTQFDRDLALLDEQCLKSPPLAAAVKEFENQDCGHVSVKHELLKVTQRIFQYHMILTDYLNNLHPDSTEYEDTQAALLLVSEVADRANDCMQGGENLQRLVHIQHSVGGQSSLLQPGREFVKEGTLMKVSEKSRHPRHLFLMNDVLLYTYPQKDGKYRLKNTLSVAGMRVSRPIGEKAQNLLKVECLDRCLTLSASSCSERDEWYSTINRTVLEYYQSHNALGYHTSMEVKEKLSICLGEKPPTLIPVSHVMMCMTCGCDFKLTLRRHHCHACGKVICRNCSRHRYPLKYLKDRIAKVCDSCYTELRKRELPAVSVSYPPPSARFSFVFHSIQPTAFKKQKKVPSALMEAASSGEGASISGYLHRCKRGKRHWKKLWFIIRGKVLYTYKASEDKVASESLPLLGFRLLHGSTEGGIIFHLYHKETLFFSFKAENSSSAQRWVEAMNEASIL